MRKASVAAFVLSVMPALFLQAEYPTLTWVGGESGSVGVAANWDPSDKGTPYEQNACYTLITNSVTFSIASKGDEYWRNVKLTVTNGSAVVFGARFHAAQDSILLPGCFSMLDVASGSSFKSTYTLGGDTTHKKTFVKTGGGLLEAVSVGVSGHFKAVRLLGGVTKTGKLCATNEVEIASGASLVLTAKNAVDTNECCAAINVNGLLDCDSHEMIIDGLCGTGTVKNAASANGTGLTLLLRAQKQEVFSGQFNGVLTVAPHPSAPADSCLVIGSAYSLTNADLIVHSTDAIANPVKFAPGIGTFYVRSLPYGRTFYDTEGNVVTLKKWWGRHLYVDGSVSESGDGLSRATAYKTIKEALESENLTAAAEWNLIHVAPGTYSNGVMGTENNLSRVVVPKNVCLYADEGPEKTFIIGRASDNPPNANCQGCGIGAVRCVTLEPGSRIEGFTLTGGRTYAVDATTSGAGRTGGGVYCSNKSGLVVDCVISNCIAVRGGGGSGGTYIRTHIVDNRATGLGSGLYLGCDLYSCVFNNNSGIGFYHAGNKSYIRNCVFGPDGGSVRADGESDAKWCEAYNTVFMGDIIGNNSRIILTNCIVMAKNKDSSAKNDIIANDKCVITGNFATAEAKFAWLGLGPDFRPLAPLSGPTVDKGASECYKNIPNDENGFIDLGGNERFSGDAIDIGPYEADSTRTFVVFSAAGGGIAATGVGDGLVEVPRGGSITVTLRRTYDSEILCTGFTVNGEFVDFEDYPEGWSVTVVDGKLSDSLDIKAVYATNVVLYVDEVSGDDQNRGYHASCPKKTLAAAFTPAPPKGSIVYVMPGYYTNGVMVSSKEGSYGDQLCRVIVPDGVTLESTSGAAVTFIGGEPSANPPAPNCHGCGSGSVRCVMLRGTSSVLRGFTCFGGRTVCEERTKGYMGGGVRGADGLVEDCVFTNCVARRGGGISSAICRRCVFIDCGATDIGSAANESFGLYNCVFRGCTNGSYIANYCLPIVNCTFVPVPGFNLIDTYYLGEGEFAASPTNVINSAVFTNTKGVPVYSNCVFASCGNTSMDVIGEGSIMLEASDSASIFSVARMAQDGSLMRGSPLIDKTSLSSYPVDRAGTVDAARFQRVSNRFIDIGAYEYDWRGDFARSFGRRGLAVLEASENVTTNSTGGLRLSDSDALRVKWPASGADARTYSFIVQVEGDGTLVYSGPDGSSVEITEADGVKSVVFSNVEDDFESAFSFSGEGTSLVYGFKRDGKWMTIIIR